MFYRLWHLSPLRVTFTKLEKQPREKKKKGPKYTFLTFNNVKQMALFFIARNQSTDESHLLQFSKTKIKPSQG